MRRPHEWLESTADSMPQNASQSAALPDLLRCSLRRVLSDERYQESNEAKLRIALRDVCERARRDAVPAERLLIVLKESWRELPERTDLPRFYADEALARVVSACINEYYQDPKVRGSDSPSRYIHEAERIHEIPPSGEIQ